MKSEKSIKNICGVGRRQKWLDKEKAMGKCLHYVTCTSLPQIRLGCSKDWRNEVKQDFVRHNHVHRGALEIFQDLDTNSSDTNGFH